MVDERQVLLHDEDRQRRVRIVDRSTEDNNETIAQIVDNRFSQLTKARQNNKSTCRRRMKMTTRLVFSIFISTILFTSTCAQAQIHYEHQNWPSLLLKYLRVPPHQMSPLTNHIDDKSANLLQSTFLNPRDFELAEHLPEEMHVTEEQLDAMQIPTLFEGDIEGMPMSNFNRMMRDDPDVFSKPYNSALNLATYPDKLWTDGRIPYMIEPNLDSEQRAAIAQAFDEYKNKTCIRFVPRVTGDVDFIYVQQNQRYGCSSYVGRAGGNQTVSLEAGKCFTKGIIAHELMHSLGFFHEHSRTDRDAYVDIVEGNIKPGMIRNFEMYPAKIVDTLDMPYDYDSVMHYHKLAFSRNGRPTIVPKRSKKEIGQRFRLSEIDAKKINKLYNCEDTTPTTTTTTTTTFRPTPTTTSRPGETTQSTTTTTAQATTTDKVVDKDCVDLNAHCEMWSAIGHCKWSEKYMNHYCRKSCEICYDEVEVTTTTAAPTTTPTTTPSTTTRMSPDGGSTTTVSTTPTTTTTTTARPTTTRKTSPTKQCNDRNLFCGYWARIGECKSESKFMRIFCKKSCGQCDED